jgi:hypothetical protein
MPLMQFYRASDRLLKHKKRIEDQMFENAQELFGFTTTVTLYDLTNSFFEGHAAENAQASYGRSKEKRFRFQTHPSRVKALGEASASSAHSAVIPRRSGV